MGPDRRNVMLVHALKLEPSLDLGPKPSMIFVPAKGADRVNLACASEVAKLLQLGRREPIGIEMKIIPRVLRVTYFGVRECFRD